MSLYKRLHAPHSPLLPLSPIPMMAASPSTFLSPYATSMRSRRSFTPNRLNVLPPPGLSPIPSSAKFISGDKKNEFKPYVALTPDQHLELSMKMSSMKNSMKKVRSSARMEARNNRLMVQLDPIRRVLFSDACTSPDPSMMTMKHTPIASTSQHLLTPNWRSNRMALQTDVDDSSQIGMHDDDNNNNSIGYRDHRYNHPHHHYHYQQQQQQQYAYNTPGLLDETFTVMSILKEINMEKYALLFAREEVDLFVFLMLTYDDMGELGIDVADRKILMEAIHCYTEFFGQPTSFF